jgi:hypothetical protein
VEQFWSYGSVGKIADSTAVEAISRMLSRCTDLHVSDMYKEPVRPCGDLAKLQYDKNLRFIF